MPGTIERGAFSLLVSHIVFFVSGYLIYFSLGRLLGESSFGVYGVVISLVSVINMVLMFATDQTVSKFVSENPKNYNAVKKTAFQLHLIISSAIFIAFVLLAPFIAMLFNDLSLTPLIRLISPLIIIHPMFSLFTGSLNGLKRFSKQAKLIGLYSVAKFSFIVGLVALGFGLVGAITGFIFSSAFIVGIGFLAIGVSFRSRVLKPERMLAFAVPIAGIAVITNLLQTLDLFAVKALTDPLISSSLAGYYTAASTIARIIPTMVLALSMVIFPLVSSTSFNKNLEKTRFYINNALRYSFLFIAPLAALFFSGASEIIDFVYGQRYLPGSEPLQILAIGFAVFALYSILTTIISASGRPRVSFSIGVLVLGTALTLNLLFVPMLSMRGAALATLLSACFGLLLTGLFVAIKFKAFLSPKSIARVLLASAVIFFVAETFPATGVMLLFKYFILIVLYLAALFGLRELKYFDLKVFKNAVRK